MSVQNRRQALSLCPDTVIVVRIQIINPFAHRVCHGIKFLRIEQFAFKPAKVVLRYLLSRPFRLILRRMPFSRSIRRYALCWYFLPWPEERIRSIPSGFFSKSFSGKMVPLLRPGRSGRVYRFVRIKAPTRQVGRTLAGYAFVNPIPLSSDTTSQAQLLHDSLDGLMVQGNFAPVLPRK